MANSFDPQKQLRKAIAKSSFNRGVLFNSYLAAINMSETKLKLDRPVNVGMSNLDL